ncbi:HalOD1 output domain-containing protein [Halorubrum ejinorense]|uniref:HalOD1 output domain-containing protein n=1 Tax=Halorubrum ejinorense TaxID=425309 RepID=A0AAV3SQD6_9EURY
MSSVHKEICVTVSETVSDALGEPVDALPPLSEAIDTDGLDAVVTEDRSHDVTIAFSYAGMSVFVCADSTVYVRPQRTPGERSPDTSA